MDFNFDTGTIFDGIQVIDPTLLPPLGGAAGVLTIAGTGALGLPSGTTLQEPSPAIGGWIRYNTDLTAVEYFNGTVWVQFAVGGGTVTSVAATTTSTGLSITGSPITTAGTLTFALSSSLQALSALGSSAGTGLLVQTGVGTFTNTEIDGTTGTIVVANGDGVAGNPTITLATAGTPVTASFVKITTDTFGRVSATTPVTTTDITTLVDGTYVNVTGDTMSGNLTFTGGSEVLGLPATPSDDTAATSKAYVDAVAAGLSWKEAVVAATTTNITLSGPQTLDGVAVVAGDRVLVKDQTDDTQNGIYIVAAGAWARSPDMDSTTPINEVNGAAVFVEQGTTQAATGWTQIDNVTTIGTDPIQWSQFSGAGSYTAGNGLTLTGNVFALATPVTPANGGTGSTTVPTAGQILIGNGTTYSTAALTAGTGIVVTNGAGTITISADPTDTVTSVSGTANQITSVPTVGAVVLSIPTTFIAPGSVEVTTTLAVDVAETINPNLSTGNIGVGLTIYGNTANDLQDWILNDGVTTAAKVDPVGNLYVYKGLGDSANSLGTSGQILTSNGTSVVWANPAATGVTSFSAGTTGFTPATATTGAVTLAGVLNAANGGTGVDTSSAPNGSLLIGNGAGLSLATLTAGTGVSIGNGAGSIVITNTGVTSVALADASTTPIYAVTGSPVTTTGTLTVTLATQAANTAFLGPVTGAAAQPTFRAIAYADLPLKLYVENPSTPTAPTAVGTNAVAVGSGASAAVNNSFAQGDGALTNLVGQRAYANGSFTGPGDAQHGVYVLRAETTNATPGILTLDDAAALLVMPNNSMWTFSIFVAAHRTDATGGGAAYKFEGGVRKDTTSGSITFIGNPSKTVLGETNTPWDVTLTIDTVNGSFNITGIGEAAKTIRWVATVLTTEVTN